MILFLYYEYTNLKNKKYMKSTKYTKCTTRKNYFFILLLFLTNVSYIVYISNMFYRGNVLKMLFKKFINCYSTHELELCCKLF